MEDRIQQFKYSGPRAEGGRDSAEGRKSFPMFQSENAISTVQIFEKGVHNNLHFHAIEEGFWMVLGGRATFYGEGDRVIAELGKYEGVLLPAGTKYWFQSTDEEPLEILRVDYKVPAGA